MSRGALADWYDRHGRHDLAWRASRDRWAVLVVEVMLQQTQVSRVVDAWPAFMARFPTPTAAVAAGPGALIEQWGRLGYPRRSRRLYDAAVVIDRDGWPDDLTELPGVGTYTAGAVRAEADDADTVAIDVNVRRVLERVRGHALGRVAADEAMIEIGTPLIGRDRLLALMDLGAGICTARNPDCDACPLCPSCASRGPRPDEVRRRQATFAGSFRQRRGLTLARLRTGSAPVQELDAEALESLVADGLALVHRGRATLPG